MNRWNSVHTKWITHQNRELRASWHRIFAKILYKLVGNCQVVTDKWTFWSDRDSILLCPRFQIWHHFWHHFWNFPRDFWRILACSRLTSPPCWSFGELPNNRQVSKRRVRCQKGDLLTSRIYEVGTLSLTLVQVLGVKPAKIPRWEPRHHSSNYIVTYYPLSSLELPMSLYIQPLMVLCMSRYYYLSTIYAR